jgi:hypothetical protein
VIPSLVMAALLIALAVASVIWLPPLHPAQLWLIPWAVATGLYVMRLLPYRALDTDTVVLACAASLAFAVGTLAGEGIGNRMSPVAEGRTADRDTATIRWAAGLALALTALLLGAFIAQTGARYGPRAALISTLTVRDALGAGQFALTIKFVYAALAATALCAVATARDRANAMRWGGAAVAAIGSIYFSTGRSTLVVAVVVGLTAFLLARAERVSRRQFVAGCAGVGAIALTVFVVGGNLIGKTYANNPGIQAVTSTFKEHPRLRVLALPYEYATAPIAALDVEVDASTRWGETGGCAAFSEACRVLHRLGLDVVGTSRVRPFTSDPLPWNTYTGLDVPLLDGGFVLAVPIVALAGLVLGCLWSLARRRIAMAICAYAILAPASVTSAGSFNFTAPHLVGGVLIAIVAITLASPLRRAFRQDPVPVAGV